MTAVIKCVIAKMNPLVMDMAIKHYIETALKRLYSRLRACIQMMNLTH
ncbi:hypothetical protein Q7266_04490 [Glaesserella parasuis]|nr:hypothetical protein [Glaesserella parasuis]MDG6259687.1 hypothetical protein [Glaesserella parasuis]MDG6269745.1 hypothetical protein [Glaesserella parasuis]MDG6297148.1 hypothetical protein [Glaesserella parasuis]MDG6331502.1 hypothetical protein [Glaesserella parasuis]MDO9848216.1 hypothetical protein [Glaesserella parasuis]